MLNRYSIILALGFIGTVTVIRAQQVPAGRGAQAPAQAAAAPADGASVYLNMCAQCHNTDDPRIPSAATLRQRTPDAVLDALTTGVMRAQGAELTEPQRRAVAEYVTGKTLGGATASIGKCTTVPAFNPGQGPSWNGWGVDVTNTRFQPAAQAQLTPEQASKLTLKWAFGYPNANTARAQPTIVGGRLFVGNQNGEVYSLDPKTGCTIWTFKADAAVRTGIVIGPKPAGGGWLAYFGDQRASAYAIDAATGTRVWMTRLDEHPNALITGTPTLYQNRLYVPVSSVEEGRGSAATYECCTFRGSLAALNIADGAVVWHTHTIDAPLTEIGKNSAGTTKRGPAGASIWSSPTVDVRRRMIYAATGNMYTGPQQPTSDSVIAFDMTTGKIAWIRQALAKDIFLVGCSENAGRNAVNCPPPGEAGPDFDFGSSPILTRLPNGKDAIIIGQKSGEGWAFDPDNKGAVIWHYQAGRGSALGGMEWGSAVDSENAYFAVADGGAPQTAGLHAVKLNTGERVWYAPPPATPACGTGRGCNAALSAAITVVPGVIFVGGMDGGMRAHSTKDGSLLWEFNTNREFQTVNGVKASGASINQSGPTVVGGMVFVNSGFGSLGGRPGNVLLAFGVD